MTGPDNNDGGTRPISVAELLAKNGTIGAPPVGGRRRRRRGNSDSVSVAELTGEIPILRTGEFPVIKDDLADLDDDGGDRDEASPKDRPSPPHSDPPQSAPKQSSPPLSSPPRPNGSTSAVRGDRVPPAQPKSPSTSTSTTPKSTATPTPTRRPEPQTQGRRGPDPAAKPELAPAPWARRGREPGPERSQYPRPVRNAEPLSALRNSDSERVGGAEQMAPDPYYDPADVDEDSLNDDAAVFGSADSGADLGGPDIDDDVLRLTDDDEVDASDDAKYLQSYLRSSNGTLFSGETVADDLARRGPNGKRAARASTDSDLLEEAEAAEVLDEDYDDAAEPSRGALVMHGVWVVLQSIFAVAFGAGLFIAFDQLWKWNNIVALVLSVLVILGLVVGVRVVRKTEDIASTLIAVAVGALVTLGPLALLQSN